MRQMSQNIQQELGMVIMGLFDKYVEQRADKFIDALALKYNNYDINIIECKELWNDISTNTKQTLPVDITAPSTTAPSTTAPSTTAPSTTVGDITDNDLMSAGVPQLKAICRALGVPVGGKKQDLLDRIMTARKNKDGKTEQNDPSKQNKTDPSKPKKKRSPNRMPSIPISSIQIKKNEHGNYEHPETKLVFNKETRQVIGRQQDDGTVTNLTAQDIQHCDQFKFTYQLPETVNVDKVVTKAADKAPGAPDQIVETLEDIIGDDDEEFEEFYESEDEAE